MVEPPWTFKVMFSPTVSIPDAYQVQVISQRRSPNACTLALGGAGSPPAKKSTGQGVKCPALPARSGAAKDGKNGE